MFEVKLILDSKLTNENRKRTENKIEELFSIVGFNNLSNFSGTLIFRDNGEKKDCGKLWWALFAIRDDSCLTSTIRSGTWRYDSTTENILENFLKRDQHDGLGTYSYG